MFGINPIDPYILGLDVRRNSGNEFTVMCPYHSDKNPSASYNVDTGLFYCYACQASKNHLQLARDLGVVGEVGGNTPKSKVEKPETKDWRELLKNPLALDNEYLKTRHVTNEQVERFGILENGQGVIFQIKNNLGLVVGAQQRLYHQNKKAKYIKHGDYVPLWPFENLAKPSKNIYICEGVFGVLRLDVLRYNAVAMMGGGKLDEVLNIIKFNSQKRFIMATDPDYAGRLNALKYAYLGIDVLLVNFNVDCMGRSQKLFLDEPETFGSVTRDTQEIINKSPTDIVPKLKKSFDNWRRKIDKKL